MIVQCPRCKKKQNVRKTANLKKVTCPTCKTRFSIPDKKTATPPAGNAPIPDAKIAAAEHVSPDEAVTWLDAPPPQKPKPVKTKIPPRPCPDCGKQISGRAASCPHCGAPIPIVVLAGRKRLAAFVGAGMLFAGVFLPVAHIPFTGGMCLFGGGSLEGILLIAAAIASCVLIYKKLYKILWITGGIPFAWLVYSFIRLQGALSEIPAEELKPLSESLLARMGISATGALTVYWGWLALFAGCACMMLAAAFDTWLLQPPRKKTAKAPKPPKKPKAPKPPKPPKAPKRPKKSKSPKAAKPSKK